MGLTLGYVYDILLNAYRGNLQILIIFTDGNPSDSITANVNKFNNLPRVIRFTVGVGSVNVNILN